VGLAHCARSRYSSNRQTKKASESPYGKERSISSRRLHPGVSSEPRAVVEDLNGRGERIRTSDPLVPNQVRYQTALRPECDAEWMPAEVRSVRLKALGELAGPLHRLA
jgi:hypothetical protein